MSTNSDSVSESSTAKTNGDIKENAGPADVASPSRKSIRDAIEATNPQDILLFLVGFRLLNALIVRTFFQPDEYYQSLEPAWQMIFGESSGAWITWVSGRPPTQDALG
jgi:GPI mannosyltransferase 3